MEEEITEGKLFATFDKYEEFLGIQKALLAVDPVAEPSRDDDVHESHLFGRLCNILDEYQEQSYLLDPFLEQLVVPVVECLKYHAKASVCATGPMFTERVGRVSGLLYQYIKCRGYKTIVRFFPHEIADMSIALDYMQMPNGPTQQFSMWPLRYVILLWLSLVCMIPFDLEQLDDTEHIGETANALEALAKKYLGKAGLEREGSAVLLSRFYMRKHTRPRFHEFLDWSNGALQGSPDLFMSIGLLQVLCEVVKSGPAEQVQAKIPEFTEIARIIEHCTTLESNTIVRKLKIKLLSRLALRILPARRRITRKARILTGAASSSSGSFEPALDSDEVPEEVEGMLEELFKGLQDRDTVVRWSAAKGTARVAERLPSDFADQVLDTITGLFAIHSLAAANMFDLPAIAESTWHGACLASAEMARRGLVAIDRLTNLIGWLSKALYFDIRKGAHSIGSNVRDAAAYVLWALARVEDISTLAPHANNIACRLVTVALYDREIQIRRAASAAFQEHVGRMSLFPHGIDVLRKTDFYAVGVRRNSFIVAAPQVAVHPEYRSFLIDHLLTVTLRHWDISMRQLGSQSLRAICQLDLNAFGPDCALKASQLFESADVTDMHGGLLALAELATAFHDSGQCTSPAEDQRHKIFGLLAKVPQDVIEAPRNELVTAAACQLIARSISMVDIKLEPRATVPHWRKIVDFGLRHRSRPVQTAAADAMATISVLVDCSSVVERLIREFRSGSPSMQQSLGRFLGVLDYDAHDHGLVAAVHCLLESVTLSSPKRMSNVEARCNCYLAMPQILATIIPRLPKHLSPGLVCELFNALLDGLEDYTLDERGDVGSWIRIACIRGLTNFAERLFSNAVTISNFGEYLPASKYHAAISGILRQGVERLDNVRQTAGEHMSRLLVLPLPAVVNSEQWRIEGEMLMKDLFLSEGVLDAWKDGAWLFPRAVKLLQVEKYRPSILAGLVLSVGTKTDSTRGPVSSSLIAYVQALPISSTPSAYDLVTFIGDLVAHAKLHLAHNAVVIPVLQTFNILIGEDALDRISEDSQGLRSLQSLLAIVMRNVARLKSMERILESMKLLVNLLPFTRLSDICVPRLVNFLAHPFPKVRTDTAEYLYLVLQSKDLELDTEEAEDILLETEWSCTDITVSNEAAQRVVLLFSGGGT